MSNDQRTPHDMYMSWWLNNTAHNNTAIPEIVKHCTQHSLNSKLFNNMTYYSHFRVLGNLAKIFGLNRGKTPKKNANFDFWSLISKFHNFRKPTFVKAWWRDVNEIVGKFQIN